MKKIFFLKGLAVMVTSAMLYACIVLLYFNLAPAAAQKSNWMPNIMSTTGAPSFTLIRLDEAKKVSDVDMLFVGSSQVFRGYDVRVFEKNGLKTFNMGTSAQTFFNSYFLLKEHLPNLNPKYVVLDLYWGVAKNDGVEPAIDILSNSEINENTLEMAFTLKNGTVLSSLAANFISRLQTPLHKGLQQQIPDYRYIPRGYLESTAPFDAKDRKIMEQLKPHKAELNDFQAEYLQKIIALCKENNTKLIFVLTPVTKELRSKIVNYDSYTGTLSKIAGEHNIPFLDYNERQELALETFKDFSDKNHLAQSGAEKFNQLFIKDLKSKGILNSIVASR